MHLFIRELGKKFDSGSVGVIAENLKKYISFNVRISVDEYKTPLGETKQIKRQLWFIDSIRFMASSLDFLSKNLVGTNGMTCEECRNEAELTHIDENYITHGACEKCRGASHCKLEIGPIFDSLRVGCRDEQFWLLLRKGVYPYEDMDNWEKFEENCLPLIEVFYSRLNLSGISECNYDHTQRVWREFGVKDLGDYHDLYLKTNVLLLSNIFETFSKAKEPGKGYLLEVDVSYPDDLHDLHNNLLFMCEKRKINGVQKQVPNLYDEKKYVIHIGRSNTG